MRILTALVTVLLLGCGRELPPSRVPSWKLLKGGEITLEEKGDSVISFVSFVSVSPNGRLLALTDARQGAVAIYSVQNGKLCGYILAPQSITDSLANSNARSWVLGHYLTVAETRQTLPQAHGELQNYYDRASFIDDSTLYVLGDVRAIFSPGVQGSSITSYIDHRMFVQRMTLKHLNGTIWYPEEDPPEATFAKRGVVLNDSHRQRCILAVANQSEFHQGHYSLSPTLAAYSMTGQRLSDIAFIPEAYWKHGLGYNFLQPEAAIDSVGDVIVAYMMSSKIFNLNSGEQYEIPQIHNLNSRYFDAACSAINSNSLTKQIPDSLTELIGASIRSVEATVGGVVIVVQYGNADTSQWGALEYSSGGVLLREGRFPAEGVLGRIREISYHQSLNSFTCISISDSGSLRMSKINWE